MKNREAMNRRRLLGFFLLLTLALILTAPASRGSANNAPSEQVVFSGVGFADDGDWESPVGFWIWCQSEGHGPYGQEHECAGAMYVYAQGITVGVDGEVVEEQDDTYTMNVFSRKEGVLQASLHNLFEDLENGPANKVEFMSQPLQARRRVYRRRLW
ncbi:MAG TPA: hypothetical protein VGQ41_05490 [Pyrinomonadaceae bacterium]|nr:hypothetical protein [Pyrinomonadaceae bacterium]